MLWNLHMNLQRKLVLAGLFSLTIIIMIIAIVRVVEVNTERNDAGYFDSSWLNLWTIVEPSVGK